MFAGPSLSSHPVELSRRAESVDVEGTPVRTWEPVTAFRGGFGAVSSSRELVVGHDGQRVDAAVSTMANIDARVGDKAVVAGREWKVVGVRSTGPTTRLLLAAWGVS
jgi:hypothetical protein